MMDIWFFDNRPPLAVIEPPPAIYDYVPEGEVIEFLEDHETLTRVCQSPNALACTVILPNFKGDKCFIVLPKGTSISMLEALRRHEYAHCNGWKH